MIRLDSVSIKSRKVKYGDLNYIFNNGIYRITSENGSGKTSLFDALVKEVEYNGVVMLGNINLNNISKDELQRGYISYVRQESNLINKLTVAENLELFVNNDSTSLSFYVEKFGIEGFKDVKAAKLSGGELKKVNIVIGLANECLILILDEPDNHLDDKSVKVLYECLSEYQGLVLLTTHTSEYTTSFKEVNLMDLPLIQETGDGVGLKKNGDNLKTISQKIEKKLSIQSLAILSVVLSLVFTIVLLNSYSHQNTINGFFNPTSNETVYDDSVILVQPPIYNLMLYSYGNSDWFERTPYLLGQDIVNAINESGLATDVVGLNEDVTISQSRIEYKGDTYYFNDASAPSYPKAIAEKFHTFSSTPTSLKGEIPDDYSNQVIIPKTYAEANNVGIGDQVELTATSGDKSHDFTYQVVGINDNDLAAGIELAYNGDDYFKEDNVNKNEQAKQDVIDLIVANSTLSPKEINANISDQNYYRAIYINANSGEDALKIINKLYEYDPYLYIQSNYDKETSQISQYQQKFTQKSIVLISIILLFVMIIILIISIFERKIIRDEYLIKLNKAGFSFSVTNKIINRPNVRYTRLIIAIITINIIYMLVYTNIQMGIVISLELIGYGVLYIFIGKRKNNENSKA